MKRSLQAEIANAIEGLEGLIDGESDSLGKHLGEVKATLLECLLAIGHPRLMPGPQPRKYALKTLLAISSLEPYWVIRLNKLDDHVTFCYQGKQCGWVVGYSIDGKDPSRGSSFAGHESLEDAIRNAEIDSRCAKDVLHG